jgi:hypothetical protein
VAPPEFVALAGSQEQWLREMAQQEEQVLAAFAAAAAQASSQKWETTSVQAVSLASVSQRGALKLEFPLLLERRGQPVAVQVHQQMAQRDGRRR